MSIPDSACYSVLRFDRRGAERQLVAGGASPDLVKRLTASLPDGLPFLVRADTRTPLAPVLLYIHRLWARPKKGGDRA